MDVCVLTSPHHREVGAQLVEELHSFGLSAECRSVASPQDSVLRAGAATIIAAVLDNEDIDELVYVAYFLGRGNRILLIDPGVQNCPIALQSITRVSLNRDTAARVVEFVQSTEKPEFQSIPTNAFEFVKWAAHNVERISDLPSREFERLVYVLLAAAGLGSSATTFADDPDAFFSDLAQRSRILVECKRFAQGSRVDLKTVRESIDRALLNNCDVAVLATNSILTQAASKFAATCVPPVWHVGVDNIKSLLSRVRPNLESELAMPYVKQLECRVLAKYPHYDAVGSILENICVPGNHDLASDLWFNRQDDLNQLFQHGVDRSDFFIFFVVTSPEEDHLSALSRPLLEKISKLGVKIWHNSPHIRFGHHCSALKDFSQAVRTSKALLIFDNVSKQRNFNEMKDLSWLASQFVESGVSRATIVSKDACRSRLRLPICFSDAIFVDEADWIKASQKIKIPSFDSQSMGQGSGAEHNQPKSPTLKP